jgi:predicted nucleic acid-binding protein
MNVIDTNIWIYRHDSRDPHKQLVAKQLITNITPLVLPWQIGCEFIAACRKLATIGFDETQAWAALADMQAIAVVLMPTPQLWQDTQSLQVRHLLSLWDALLIAACLRGGVQTLYTEDMGAPRVVDSLTLVNPFSSPAAAASGS